MRSVRVRSRDVREVRLVLKRVGRLWVRLGKCDVKGDEDMRNGGSNGMNKRWERGEKGDTMMGRRGQGYKCR